MSTPNTHATPPPRVPGEEGVWLFVAGDLLIFSLFFGTYLYYLGQQRSQFAQAQTHLSEAIGMLNTFLLLTSSWFVARAVEQRRSGTPLRARRLLQGAMICGVLFLIDKGVEWRQLIGEGHTLLSDYFFMLYYMFTGIHAVHVLLGLAVLTHLHHRAGRAASADIVVMENGATFWHLVDLLWIVLFALFYLVR